MEHRTVPSARNPAQPLSRLQVSAEFTYPIVLEIRTRNRKRHQQPHGRQPNGAPVRTAPLLNQFNPSQHNHTLALVIIVVIIIASTITTINVQAIFIVVAVLSLLKKGKRNQLLAQCSTTRTRVVSRSFAAPRAKHATRGRSRHPDPGMAQMREKKQATALPQFVVWGGGRSARARWDAEER
eukprot:3164267-Pleurochrysis_carterae.AAC.1